MYCFEMKLVLEEIFGNYNNKETSFKIGVLEKIKQIFVNEQMENAVLAW